MSAKKNQPAPTELGEDMDRFETWVIQYRKQLLWGCAGIIVIVLCVVIVLQIRSSRAEAQKEAFAGAVTMETLENLLKKDPAGPYASEARLRLARMAAEKKDYAKASSLCLQVSKDEQTVIFLRGRAAVDAAGYMELAGRNKEALALYESAARGNYPEVLLQEAFYGAGRMHLAAGNVKMARTAFKRASARQPVSEAEMFWRFQAKLALDRLPAETKAAPAAKPSPAVKPAADPAAKVPAKNGK